MAGRGVPGRAPFRWTAGTDCN